MFVTNFVVIGISTISKLIEEYRKVKVEQFNLRILQDYGYVSKVVVQSVWQKLARLGQIEWAFFDGIPPRVNV